MDDRKYTLVYTFNMVLAIVSWNTKNKSIVSISAAKHQYKAATTPACEAIWFRIILRGLHE